MFNKLSLRKDEYMLNGKFAKKGYDWWWHSLTARSKATGEEKPFYIEYFIINPKVSPSKVILGQSKEAKEKKLRPSYLMVNVGTWGKVHKQLHRFFPLNEVSINKCPISIAAGDCELDENHLKGSVDVKANVDGDMSDLGSMSWDLKIHKDIAWNVGYGTSKAFCDLKAFEMYWHAEGMKSSYEGTIIFGGDEYIVSKENSYGYQDKNWGSDFTTPWLWLSSNNITDNVTGEKLHNSVFDIGGGKPRVFGVSLPRKLLAGYYIEGKEYEMNFSKFLTHPCKTEFSFDDSDPNTVHWNVVQTDKKYKIVTDVTCFKKDMIMIRYETPTGKMPFSHLNNGGNGFGTLKIYEKKTNKLIHDLTIKNVGCEYGEFDNL